MGRPGGQGHTRRRMIGAGEMTLSDKYMAGFFDADGSLMARARIGARPDLIVEVAQRALYREIPDAFASAFGGMVRTRQIGEGDYASYTARGRMARKAVEQLKGYLLCKGTFAAGMMRLVDEAPVLGTEDDVAAFRARVKALRQQPNASTANFPPRK